MLHGSLGNYYSFDNKDNYAIENNLSAGIYASKKIINKFRQSGINALAEDIELICANEMNETVGGLGKVIPMIKYMISSVIDTTNQMQNSLGESILNNVETSSNCCCNVFLSVNVTTKGLHT